MLKILKFLYGFRFLMFRGCIQSDVVVVHGLKNMQFAEWWKSPLKDFSNLKKSAYGSSSKVKK